MSRLLEHRGFYGSIEVSPEDNCLFGKLQFITALVSDEGQTAAELSQAFRDAVDEYVAVGALASIPHTDGDSRLYPRLRRPLSVWD